MPGHGYSQLSNLSEYTVENSEDKTPLLREGTPLLRRGLPSGEAVLEVLISTDENFVLWALAKLAATYPHLMPNGGTPATSNEEYAPQSAKAMEILNLAAVKPCDPDLVKPDLDVLTVNQNSDDIQNTPSLEFAAPMYFCHEDEPHVELEVLRIGPKDRVTKVCFETEDNTAKAGKAYVATKGILVFQPGESSVNIRVDLVNIDWWETQAEFNVHLRDEGIQNGALDHHLSSTRVRIIETGTFPSKRFKDAILNDEINKVSKISLIYEYVTYTMLEPVLRARFYKQVFAAQVHNANFIFTLFLRVYLVDYVLDMKQSEDDLYFSTDRVTNLAVVVSFLMIPLVVEHFLDLWRIAYWGLTGRPRAFLQQSIMRKFFNLSHNNKLVKNGHVVMAIMNDSFTLTANVLGSMVKLTQLVGKIVLILIYDNIAPLLFGKPCLPYATVIWCAFPICMAGFLYCRSPTTLIHVSTRQSKLSNLHQRVDEAVNKKSLLIDFQKRNKYVSDFETELHLYNHANRCAHQVLDNNIYFVKWLSCIFITSFTFMGGLAVMGDSMSLGMYLAKLKTLAAIGTCWMDIYNIVLDVHDALPALERIIGLLNMATDGNRRKGLTILTNKASHAMRSDMRDPRPVMRRQASVSGAQVGVHSGRDAHQGESRSASAVHYGRLDSLCIRVQNLGKKYALGSNVRPVYLNLDGNLAIPQGTLCAITGPHAEGKSTLLKLIAGAILAHHDDSELTIFIPSHLRIMHCAKKPMFLEGSLLKNLQFGLGASDADGSLDRVLKICTVLGLPDRVLDLIKSEEVLNWDDCLSGAQCQLLSCARALIANFEVLCIHHPISGLGATAGEKVMGALQSFVDFKGIAQDPKEFTVRRPRTCFITHCSDDSVPKEIDVIVKVSQANGIERFTKSEVEAPVEEADMEDLPQKRWSHDNVSEGKVASEPFDNGKALVPHWSGETL